MIVNIDHLSTLHNWAQKWKRPVLENGKMVMKTGCTTNYVHELFNPYNMKPVAQRVREEYELILVDGVKFVIKKSDLHKHNKKS